MWSFEVPSPPCGMETYIKYFVDVSSISFRAHRVGWRREGVDAGYQILFLFRAHRVGWRLCLLMLGRLLFVRFRAHRVGWRRSILLNPQSLYNRSEPTVWDGDCKYYHLKREKEKLVPSPPCGMETPAGGFLTNTPIPFRAHRVGWRLLEELVLCWFS